MSKAYAYVRYSSTVQAEGDSVERQMTPLEAFERQFGIKIEKVFLDAGVSSFRGDNARKGELKKILTHIEKGTITRGDYIVVESIDRITRQRLIDGVELIQSILKKGVRIYTTFDRQTYSYDDPAQDFQTLMMIGLIAQRANEESATKSRRRKSAWNKAKLHAANEGKVFNKLNPPYGLRFDADKEAFVIEESEADEIRAIFKLLKVMGVSLAIRKVNETSKRKWTNKAIQQMIKNQYPIGVLMSQRRDENRKKVFLEFIDGYYPSIITHVDFRNALSAMKARKTKHHYGMSTTGNVNIFKHVAKCGRCGKSLIFEKQTNQKGELYTYYNCLTRKELKGDCDQRFRFDLAFGMLMSVTSLLNPKKSKVGMVGKVVLPSYVEDFLKQKAQQAWDGATGARSLYPLRGRIEQSLDEKERRQAQSELGINLFSMLGAGRDKKPEITQKLNRETERLIKLKTMLENLDQSVGASIEAAEKIPDTIMRRLNQLEIDVQDQTKLVDDISVEHDAVSMELPIASPADLIEKFGSEVGRLELNNFFIGQELEFKFEYDSRLRGLRMDVIKDDAVIVSVERNFRLHKPLKEYGIDRLNDLWETEGPEMGL